MSMYKWNVYQVYRALRDFDNYGSILPKGMLVQVIRYEGSSVTLKSEEAKRYIVSGKELLNEADFQRVF